MDTPATEVALQIDVVSDVVCPWCYIGQRRLAVALRQLEKRRPEIKPLVRWLPFQLNPDLPAEGIPRAEYVAKKFGARGKSNYDRVTMVGQSLGIPFAFDKIEVQPNTLNAHRLLRYAEQHGRQHEVAEALFQAYFLEGGNLTDIDTLASVAERVGLDHAAARAYLASDDDKALVAEADEEARRAGVEGVPFFIFNRAVAVSGAQEPDTLVDAMLQSLEQPKA